MIDHTGALRRRHVQGAGRRLDKVIKVLEKQIEEAEKQTKEQKRMAQALENSKGLFIDNN